MFLTLIGLALVVTSCPKPMQPPPCQDESCKPPISDPNEPPDRPK